MADVFAGADNIFKQALTFGGHPVTAAVALKNIEIMETEGLVQNSEQTGAYILERLEDLAGEHRIIGNVRGRGLLMGIELVSDRDSKTRYPKDVQLGNRLSDAFESEGLILRCGDERVSLGPPLCITRDEADELVAKLDRSLSAVERTCPANTASHRFSGIRSLIRRFRAGRPPQNR